MLRRIVFIFVILLGAVSAFSALRVTPAVAALPWQSGSPVLEASQVLRLNAPLHDDGSIVIGSKIAKDHYVYRHSLRIEDASGNPVDFTLSDGKHHFDEFFGKSEIYYDDDLRLKLPALRTDYVVLHWQGCAQAGICYPPQTIRIALSNAFPPAEYGDASAALATIASSSEATETAASAESAASAASANASGATAIPPAPAANGSAAATAPDALAADQEAANQLATLDPVAAKLLFFGLGLMLAFTPCVLPMVPIVSTMIVGNQPTPMRALSLSCAYVLAMALTYASIGVAAALAGANLQATLQSPWLLSTFAALFLVLAASLFGMFEVRLPSFIVSRLDAAGRHRTGGSLTGAAMLGLLSALLVGPCMTAPLAGALLYIGQTGNAWMGGGALFAMGLGMGTPLLAIALFGARILPRPGAWMMRVRIAFAYVMVGMAIMMLGRFLPAHVSLALWGALGLGLAVGLGAWAWAMRARTACWALVFASALAALWSLLVLVGAASGGDSLVQPLAHVRAGVVASLAETGARAGKPVDYVSVKSADELDARIAQAVDKGQWTLIDFYADWCASCHVIERNVFGDPTVAARLAQMQVLRPDVTKHDAIDQTLMKRWGVLGPPTLILVDATGKEVREHRMVGEMNATTFLSRLDAAQSAQTARAAGAAQPVQSAQSAQSGRAAEAPEAP
ncbi:thiol:disulfide interchange protein [Pandoraea captiosa]|uniref:Thiol:disulfide interchange protein n=1 Tax=Pandoraea captiosa TaxID=2508302 RepID=A0A5E5AJ40_9BURK|nr:protein-disulfide reductase DsbD [Pandoraea captiosa]VVE73288.1 thiol:disulfide interchange protein [Pandoraea captiosa]